MGEGVHPHLAGSRGGGGGGGGEGGDPPSARLRELTQLNDCFYAPVPGGGRRAAAAASTDPPTPAPLAAGGARAESDTGRKKRVSADQDSAGNYSPR